MAAVTDTKFDDGWEDKANAEFFEGMSAMMRCPEGSLLIWQEEVA